MVMNFNYSTHLCRRFQPIVLMLEMAMFVHVLLLALTQLLTLATTEHVVYNGTTQEGGGDQQTRTLLDEIDTEVRGVVRDMILPRIRPNSCSEIAELHPGLPSGYYVINPHTARS